MLAKGIHMKIQNILMIYIWYNNNVVGLGKKIPSYGVNKVQTESKYIVPKWECQECARKTTCNFVYRNISENSIDCMFKHWKENLKRV